MRATGTAGMPTSSGEPRIIQVKGIRRKRSTARILREYGEPKPPTSFIGAIVWSISSSRSGRGLHREFRVTLRREVVVEVSA